MTMRRATTKTRKLLALLAVLLGLLSVPAIAADPHIEVSVATRSAEPRPGGTTRIAITLTPDRGWHAYWLNPGDSGLPPEAQWRLPQGVTITKLEHPAPSLLELGGLASYVHEGPVTLLADLKVDRSLAAGTPLPIRGTLTLLACSDSLCVPERAELALDLRTGNGQATAASAALFRSAETRLPGEARGEARLTRLGSQWQFALPLPANIDASRVRLYPDKTGWFDAGAAQSVKRGGADLVVTVPATTGPTPDGRFSGILSDGRHSLAVEAAAGAAAAFEPALAPESAIVADAANPALPVSVPQSTEGRPVAALSGDDASTAIRTALLGALIGGLLLNLMPCVFPILSLKALSLARSGADRSSARIEGTAYAAGSVVATTALGAVLLGARAMGQDIGWAFQLQDPRIILVLLILTLAIALNLAGLFEIRGPAVAGSMLSRPGWQGAFGTGALAAVIATPCSGPFMGVALGAALVLPTAAALAVFAGLGIGMALPFLLIAFVPQAQKALPRPGPWMDTFRRLLAIPMMATAIALAWVLGRQSGVDGMTIGLAIAALAALGLWWAGIRQQRGKPARLALVPLAAAVLALFVVDLPTPPPAAAASDAGQMAASSEPFSEQRLAELQAAGTPVFVDMTADWCLICQVNERVAIDRPATREAFAKAGVVTLVGDWTTGDPAITRFLASRGRNSIPYYLFASKGRMVELPQVLSADLLVDHAVNGET